MGWTVHTLEDVYGRDGAMKALDVEWIELAAVSGWSVLTKDKKLRSREPESDALERGGVVAFCLMHGRMSRNDQAAAFDRLSSEIGRVAAASTGHGIFGVYRTGPLQRVWP